jgi:hypothetical protein
MQHLLDETPRADQVGPRRRAMFVAGSVLITCAILIVAIWLGTVAYWLRLVSMHEGRLRNLSAKRPTVETVAAAFAAEKSALVASPQDAAELSQAAALHGSRRLADILAKGQQWPTARVFQAGEVSYFIFFDSGGVMRDFVCVRR